MNFDVLKPRIDGFIDFARKFPAPYRAGILSYLLQMDAAERGILVTTASPRSPVSVPGGTVAVGPTGTIHSAIAELAAEIDVPVEVVDRRLVTVVDGRPEIRWKSDDVSRARRQIEYALVYTYVMEKLGEDGARIEELRALSVKKRSYDPANFMANFKRPRDLLQIADVPGGKEQEIVLTGPGREEVRRLLARAGEGMSSAAIAGTIINETESVGDQSEEPEQQNDG